MSNGDVFKLTIEAQYVDVSIAVQNVLWFQQTSATPVAFESQQLADDFLVNGVGAVSSLLMRNMYPTFRVNTVRCQKYLFDYEPPVTSTGGSVHGDGGGGIVPATTCMVVTLRTAVNSRRKTGRLYLGGFDASSNPETGGGYRATIANHGQWSTDCLNNIQAWCNGLLGRYNGVTVLDVGSGLRAQWGVWSKVLGLATPPHNVAGFEPITHFTVGANFRVQRRRELGHGI